MTSKDTHRFPSVPEALLTRLEVIFPDRMPDPSRLDPTEVAVKAGNVEVVRLLRFHFNQQTKTVLEQK